MCVIQNIDMKLPSDAFKILDAFSMLEFQEKPTNASLTKVSVCACNELDFFVTTHFFENYIEIQKTVFVDEYNISSLN